MKDGETIITKDGGKQSFVSARVDLIPPECLLLLGQCLGFGADKYGEENWKKIPLQDHLNHVMVHVLKFQAGDRTEPHLVNVLARGVFALWRAIEQGEQGTTYIHPDMMKDGNSNEEEKEGFTSGEEIMRRNAKPAPTPHEEEYAGPRIEKGKLYRT